MKLSEKIQYLRKEHSLTQEQLAEQCNVADRQLQSGNQIFLFQKQKK